MRCDLCAHCQMANGQCPLAGHALISYCQEVVASTLCNPNVSHVLRKMYCIVSRHHRIVLHVIPHAMRDRMITSIAWRDGVDHWPLYRARHSIQNVRDHT